MSTPNIETFCSGGTFDFDVGPSRTRFTLHRKLVSRHSDPLNALMSVGLRESQEGVAVLQEVDADTFARFAEYIYCGDYSAAAPEKDVVEERAKDNAKAREATKRLHNDDLISMYNKKRPCDGFASWGNDHLATVWMKPQQETSLQNPEPPAAPIPLDMRSILELTHKCMGCEDIEQTAIRLNRFKKAPFFRAKNIPKPTLPKPDPVAAFPLDVAPGPNDFSALDHAPTFLGHARVYIFAQEYLIPNLAALAATKLLNALNLFQNYPSRAGNIARLVRFVYENTPDDDEKWERKGDEVGGEKKSGGGAQPKWALREIVVWYVASNLEGLVAEAAFRALLAEGGAFVPDLCHMAGRMLF